MGVTRIAREIKGIAKLKWLHLEWRIIGNSIPASARSERAIRRVLLVPSDPYALVGAKGDEAMLQAAVGFLRQRVSPEAVGVMTATLASDERARELGFVPLRLWNLDWHISQVWEGVRTFDPDTVLVVGADVLDGHYNAADAARMLVVADMAVRNGMRATLLGFSFNQRPDPRLRSFFNNLSSGLTINLRDPISLSRFRFFSRAPARLVADVAFLLEPDPDAAPVRSVAGWARQQRESGRTVMGINLHSMLFGEDSSRNLDTLLQHTTSALGALLEERPISLVLLAHDFRKHVEDDRCLGPIASRLSEGFGDRVLYPTAAMSARQLKAACGHLDAVFAARMHLAVASLGMGVPVAAITYQDKFEGLFDHFGLSRSFLLPANEALVEGRLRTMLFSFIENIAALRAQVQAKLPAVLAGSARNFDGVL